MGNRMEEEVAEEITEEITGRKEMIAEVLFSEGEAMAMKMAKHIQLYGRVEGPSSLWVLSKEEPPEKEEDRWLEGSTEDVVCLCYRLDIGELREELDSITRRRMLLSMYGKGKGQGSGGRNAEKTRVFGINDNGKLTERCQQMERLKEFLERGYTIRIWYSDAPYSRCGLYHLCHVLETYENKIRVVRLPEYVVRGACIVCYRSWEEVAAEEFAGFLEGERELTTQELRLYASLWRELVEDNSPLRVMVNGRILGVPEDFYDFMLWNRLKDQPVREYELLGDVIGHYQDRAGDWWFARRIQHWIDKGRIKVLEEADGEYGRMLCRAEAII